MLRREQRAGKPVEISFSKIDATPVWAQTAATFKDSPHPNAARLFQCFCFSAECQQLISDVGGQRSAHPQIKEKAGRMPFKDVKTMKEDAAGVEKQAAEIKARYSRIFKV